MLCLCTGIVTLLKKTNFLNEKYNSSVHAFCYQTKNNTFPVKPILSGMSSVACNINRIWSGAGVQVVAHVPCAGPVPPPIIVVIPKLLKQQHPVLESQNPTGEENNTSNGWSY